MEKILIVSSSIKGTKVFAEYLRDIGYNNIDVDATGAAARRRLIHDEYSLVIIDTPLKDEFGSELAIKITESGLSEVIVITKSENADMIGAKLEEYGVFIIPKPFSKSIFYQGIKFVFTSLRRVNALKTQQNKLMKKVEDIRVVNRAKCILMQYENMTENDAHKYLEKEAMNTRVSKRELAEKIINYYEV